MRLWDVALSRFLHSNACCWKRGFYEYYVNVVGFGLVTMEDFSLGVGWFLLRLWALCFIYLTSPTSTHVLMKAAFEDNHMPLDEKDLKKAKGKRK